LRVWLLRWRWLAVGPRPLRLLRLRGLLLRLNACCSSSRAWLARLLGGFRHPRHRRRLDAPVLLVGREQQVLEAGAHGVGLGPRQVDEQARALFGDEVLFRLAVVAGMILLEVFDPAVFDRLAQADAAGGFRLQARRPRRAWPGSSLSPVIIEARSSSKAVFGGC
jgi:hypothetical protein